ncbi:MAG: pyridoxal phosphate-dependent aminotransferase [Synergistaceae bacterium]|jgi:aspartate/methionine/tyrosine aminotransferase|nr:pyridoxal phosphate-dependent aminotransferase [Synergistaceae bacterium]
MVKVSKRCETRPASGIRKMGVMAANYTNVLNLGIGEPDFNIDKNVAEALKKAVDAGKNKYAPTAGIPELRAAVARKLKRENEIDCDVDSILVTHGACEAIQTAILGTTDVGDEVLIPDPSWPNYQGQIHMAGCKSVFYPLLEKDRFHATAEQIAKNLTPKTRLLFLNSPSNPTGGVTTKQELLEIAELVKKHDLAVISDEPYEKLLYGGAQHVSIGSLPGMRDYVFTANTCSKTYAMTGLRVGYLQGPKDAMTKIVKIQEGASSCVNTPAQWAAVEALEGSQSYVNEMLSQYTARRDILVKGLNSLPGVDCLAPEGAFYVFPNISKLGKSQQVAEDWLKRAQLITIPGSAFGEAGEGFLRICFAVSEATLREALSRLSSILEELPAK